MPPDEIAANARCAASWQSSSSLISLRGFGAPGRGGCTIYETRPPVCRNWNCNWIVEPGPRVAAADMQNDPVLQTALRAGRSRLRKRLATYYGQLKQCSRTALETKKQVVVYIRKRTIVILPDKDVDLGNMEIGDQIWAGPQYPPQAKLGMPPRYWPACHRRRPTPGSRHARCGKLFVHMRRNTPEHSDDRQYY